MSLQESDAASAAVATAPRVSLADIEGAIAFKKTASAAYAVGWDGPGEAEREAGGPDVGQALSLLTLCILVMKNGFTVVGKSAPASPENFNAELGAKFAYEDAIRQLWPLMGFALRDKLAAL